VSTVESVLQRERIVIGAGLAVLTVLAWVYVWRGAGMGMSALAMTKLALFPHLTPEPMPDMIMPPITWVTVTLMWWVMMVAMMVPSAAPLILLYGRVMRHAEGQRHVASAYLQTTLLTTGYLAAWLAFSIVATALQYAFQRTGLISHMMLWSQSTWLSAIVLAGAGLYQLSPLKLACLKHCRGPADFIGKHMRQGNAGALIMGIEHGAWCVGCCWMLMALLFVGGVMNLVWIALIALLVLVEKVTPQGEWTGRIAGGSLIVWSIATLLI